MKHWIRRLAVGLLFAIPMMMLSYALAEASNAPQASPNPENPDCVTCHEELHTAWQGGAHGQATDDPAFKEAWTAAGQLPACLECHVTGYDAMTETWEANGVTCTACHDPISENHPLEPMTADRSGKVCSDCHVETYFEWQVSAHAGQDLDCTVCHDPHGTEMKAESAEALCASCHRARSSNFTHSGHSQQGLNCDDCHMARLKTDSGEGHLRDRRDHSFFVSLEACTSCHVYQMHDPVEAHPEPDTLDEPVDAMAAVQSVATSAEPMPVSPLGFTMLSGLIGIAVGIIVAPWVERLQRRPKYEDQEEKEDGK
jgi:predicted CXXCH cytochrome family protein